MAAKKRFFAKHSKSSAMVVSLAVHGLLLIVALSFVAVTVVTKADKKFETKHVARPKMPPKKLQVPVKIKKQQRKPKLRKRIVAKAKPRAMPDIKMPEISGIKGGIGATGGAGLGGAATVGFSMPEIEIFGIKGKGEKIVLVLDAGAEMMWDKMGGITAYTIIKEELVRIVDELPSTALFNVLVYEWKTVAMSFPTMVPANEANTRKMEEWLMPLNSVKVGMGADEYGLDTLGKGGVINRDLIVSGKFENTKKVGGMGEIDVRSWYRPSMLSHMLQADTIFVLTRDWDLQRIPIAAKGMSREEWNKTAAGKKWNEAYRKSLKALDAEQARRKAAGEPPKIITRNEWGMRKDYYPDLERPPVADHYHYTPRDFVEGFILTREKYKPKEIQAKSGLGKKKSRKVDFSFNVIQFVPQGEGPSENTQGRFNELTTLCKGDYKTISGLKAIQNYVSTKDVE